MRAGAARWIARQKRPVVTVSAPDAIMRLLAEIFIIAGLLTLGWEKPFKQWAGQTAEAPAVPTPAPMVVAVPPPSAPIVAATVQPYVRPSVTPSGSWLFDPNHKATLDPPARKSPPH